MSASRSVSLLWIAVISQLALYLVVCWLSNAFVYNSDVTQRPIPLVLALLWTNFAIHLVALNVAVSSTHEVSVLRVIVLGALAFRGVMIFSQPIQEIDIYRYCWDGAVLRNGVNPFRYSPHRVRTADRGEIGISTQLNRLIDLREREPGLARALGRVHYAKLTTIYPPISQVLFAAADVLTPSRASLETRILTMKSVICMFDLAVLAILSRLLSLLGMHQGWLITYAWCPLVLKEFAGSGHLDAIAVCFCCLSLLAFVQGTCRGGPMSRRWLLAASALLAIGVGAKLYPIILLPMLASYIWTHYGWRPSLTFTTMTVSLSLVILSPMLLAVWNAPVDQVPRGLDQTAAPEEDGLATFLTRWEMNDLLFMLVEENLRPAPSGSSNSSAKSTAEPWFVIVPRAVRTPSMEKFAAWLGTTPSKSAFLLARLITLAIFALCAICFAYRASMASSAAVLLECSFLTLAWFWLLAPTQNPWYWSWALPLAAFARGQAWLAMSGLSLIYYLRFWFLYQFPDRDIWLAGYPGTRFFDHVIVWLEYAPLLLVLWLTWAWRKRKSPAAGGAKP